jgi:hypothetical protein
VIKTRIVIAFPPLNLWVEIPFHQRFSATFERPPDVCGRARGFICGRQHFTKVGGEEADEMSHLNVFELWRRRGTRLLRGAGGYRLASRSRMAPQEKYVPTAHRVHGRTRAVPKIAGEDP